MEKLNLNYLNDIMSKANYALMEKEINAGQHERIILLALNIIQEIYKKEN